MSLCSHHRIGGSEIDLEGGMLFLLGLIVVFVKWEDVQILLYKFFGHLVYLRISFCFEGWIILPSRGRSDL